MEEPSKLDVLPERSEEVQELLGRNPIWMIRWGTVLVVGMVVVLGALSWVIKFPDVLKARIILTSTQPPIDVHARSAGRIAELFVSDSQQVSYGAPLALIESSADWEDMRVLQQVLDSLQRLIQDEENLPGDLKLPQSLALGPVQGSYARLVDAWTAYSSYYALNPVSRERAAVMNNLAQQESVLVAYEAQIPRLEQAANLAENAHSRNKKLYQEQVISESQLETTERSLLEAKGKIDELSANLAQSKLQISRWEAELVRINVRQPEAEIQLRERFTSSLDQLASAIQDWEQNFLLRAPIQGRTSFFSYWSPEQYVELEASVMTLVPTESSPIVGKVLLPIQNSGKVAIGHRVNILLDNYPFQEFGFLTGKISQISLVPQGDSYALDVSLPQELETSYGQTIPFRQELQGTAEIVTEDLRLIERILYQLRKAWRESW
ncbi:MAG: HlyD family efflux transporter periplasmic adaptor subunit [Bacteroidota bacterium]